MRRATRRSIAAEAGNAGSADCVILRAIEDDITAPTSKTRITQVLIYRSDANGTVKNSNTYVRSDPTRRAARWPTAARSRSRTRRPRIGYRGRHALQHRRRLPDRGADADAGHDRRPDHLHPQLGDAARQLPRRAAAGRPRSSSPTRCAWSRSCDRPRSPPAPGASPPGRRRAQGQGLVEFAILVPMFMLLLMGMLEFGLAFSHHQTLQYATREGARAGAALSNGGGKLGCGFGQSPNKAVVDPQIIAAVERVLTSDGSPVKDNLSRIPTIRIYLANANGNQNGGNVERLDLQPGRRARSSTASISTTRRPAWRWDACNRNANPAGDGPGRPPQLHVPDADRPRARSSGFFGQPGAGPSRCRTRRS